MNFSISSQLTNHSLSSQPISAVIMPKHHCSKPPSPTNVDAFLTKGQTTKDRPVKCVFSGQIGKVIGCEDYYFENECVLCMRAFSTSVVATTIDDGASPPGSTELDYDTGHNCKIPKALYKAFCPHVLGLPPNSWASHRTELAFRNLIIQDLDVSYQVMGTWIVGFRRVKVPSIRSILYPTLLPDEKDCGTYHG
jgi:hypothetical protein